MKKSTTTQELVNTFPPWSRVREDSQSIGYQLLNALSVPIEGIAKELSRAAANEFLSTANLDEIDIFHKAILPPSFVFDTSSADPLKTIQLAPTVSGVVSGVSYLVASTEENSVESVWYDTLPNRVSLVTVVTGTDDVLLDLDASQFPQEGTYDHHLGGGHIHLETASGIQYISLVKGEVVRAQVVLTGTTRKGATDEKDNIVFPWNQKQKSLKEWKQITKVETQNIPSGIQLTIKSGDYAFADYISPWNLRVSDRRRKIDEFWGLGTSDNSKPVLNRIEYTSDEWEQLVSVGATKAPSQSWELLDEDWAAVDGIDMAIQPFSDRAWIVTTTGMLYCYDLAESMPSGLAGLRGKTPGSNVQLEADFREVIFGEDFEFIPWHAKPIEEILAYRLYYKDPTGTVSGLNRGIPVPYSNDFWIRGQQLRRTIEDVVLFPTAHRGEYLFTFEAFMAGGETHTEKVLFKTTHKIAQKTFDLSSLISGTVSGIEFDSDQYLWVKTDIGYHRINLHYDVMLIDFDSKILYFKEDYDTVDVITDG